VTRLVLVGTRNSVVQNKFVGLNVADGTTAWQFLNVGSQGGDGLEMGSTSSPAMFIGSQLYFTTRARVNGSAHTLWAINFTASSARLAWGRDLGNIDAAPTLDFTLNRILVGTVGGSVYALEPATGATVWSRSFGDGAVKTFISYHEAYARLYFATNTTVWGIPASGELRNDWSLGGLFSPTRPLTHYPTTRTYVGSCADAGCKSARLIELDAENAWSAPKALTMERIGGLGPVTIDRSQTPALLLAGSRTSRVVAIELPLP